MDRETRTVEKIKEDFSEMKKKFTADSGAQLMSDISALLGIYGIGRGREMEDLLRGMILFAKEKKLAVIGAELEFNLVKNRRK